MINHDRVYIGFLSKFLRSNSRELSYRLTSPLTARFKNCQRDKMHERELKAPRQLCGEEGRTLPGAQHGTTRDASAPTSFFFARYKLQRGGT